MQGARALVEVLAERGVEHSFGLPGDSGCRLDRASARGWDQGGGSAGEALAG